MGRGGLLIREEWKSERGQFLCYSSLGKPLWVSATSVLASLGLWLLQTVCLSLSPSQRHIRGGTRARDDNTRARASEEDGCQHCPWQGIDRSGPVSMETSPALLCDAVLGTSTTTASPWLCPRLLPRCGALGWACPQGDQGLFLSSIPLPGVFC